MIRKIRFSDREKYLLRVREFDPTHGGRHSAPDAYAERPSVGRMHLDCCVRGRLSGEEGRVASYALPAARCRLGAVRENRRPAARSRRREVGRRPYDRFKGWRYER